MAACNHHCPLTHPAPSLWHWYTGVYLRIFIQLEQSHHLPAPPYASIDNKTPPKKLTKLPHVAITVPSGNQRHLREICIPGYTFGSSNHAEQSCHIPAPPVQLLTTTKNNNNKTAACSHGCPLRHPAPSLGLWYTGVYLRIFDPGPCNPSTFLLPGTRINNKIPKNKTAAIATTVPSRTLCHHWGIGIPGIPWDLQSRSEQSHHLPTLRSVSINKNPKN